MTSADYEIADDGFDDVEGEIAALQDADAAQPSVDPVIRRAVPVSVTGDTDELIAAAIEECLEHFEANSATFLKLDHVGAVHQMRVALRRLRAFLKLFNHDVQVAKFATLRQQAGELASAFGVARELDVFAAMVAQGPALLFHNEEGMRLFMAACERRRAEGYGAAHEALAAPQTHAFIEDLRQFQQMRSWREALGEPEQCAILETPAKTFVRALLDREDRKCRKKAKRFSSLDENEKHELRIRFKALRYATEAFGPLICGRRKLAGYRAALAQVQDGLGAFNDLVVARKITEELRPFLSTNGLETKFAKASGMVLGWCARAQQETNAASGELVAQFRNARRPWD